MSFPIKRHACIHMAFMVVAVILFSCNRQGQEVTEDLVQYVNPLIGTPFKGNAGTFPAVNTPFAMTNFMPATDENDIGLTPYHYERSKNIGFIASHQPAVWMGDYGFVTLWPSVGRVRLNAADRALTFSHRDEISAPDMYQVKMFPADSSYSVTAKMSASSRCGIFEFNVSGDDTMNIVVEASRAGSFPYVRRSMFDKAYVHTIDSIRSGIRGFVKVDPPRQEIYGYNPERQSFMLGPELPDFKGYFVIRFEKPFDSYGVWQDSSLLRSVPEMSGQRVGGYAGFDVNELEKIRVKVGTSFISIEQARENLDHEIPGWDMQQVITDTHDEWQKALEHIVIEGTKDQKAVFYTAMYHAMLYPREFSEYGRYYSAFDDSVHKGTAYNDYSLWDTFRAEHPLLLFIAPDRVPDMITSLLNMYKEGGWMPKWPNPAYSNIMIGTHADAVIADAMVKGVKGFDRKLAWEAVRKDAFVPPPGDTGNINYVPSPWTGQYPGWLPGKAGNPWYDRALWHGYEARGGLTWYKDKGFVPCDMTNESVSRTLEFAYDDYCAAAVANEMKQPEDFKVLMKRSKNYEHLYRSQTGFMEPKLADGSWLGHTDNEGGLWGPEFKQAYTEGSPWTYLFCAMQDIPGLIDLMGGPEKFVSRLDQNFDNGHYVHQNEPGHHYPYLYDYAGYPSKTQEKVRQYTLSQYKNKPSGLDGNDDCGQMSAWYIFSAMGFYPVCPGSDQYAIGSPLFPEARIALSNGKTFTIRVQNASEQNKYIQEMRLNGKPWNKYFISHSDIMEGGTMIFVMGNTPVNKKPASQ
ncbi:MAG TPA: GH92 family glycosyl hydrolase [Bacteroidales bacterium]|nr:GH92 family glycosyl hydrolase [Bacteroidales bacterium]